MRGNIQCVGERNSQQFCRSHIGFSKRQLYRMSFTDIITQVSVKHRGDVITKATETAQIVGH